MAISPWVVGQTHPIWRIPFTNESGPVDLTGATVTLWIFTREGTSVQGAGTCTVETPPTSGYVDYPPQTSDSPKPGNFWVALKAVFADGSILWQQPAVPWNITNLP